MKKETQTLITKAVENWEMLKKSELLSNEKYGTGIITKVGDFYWDNPDLLWLLVFGGEDDYDGSETQIGLSRDGKLKWEYQSHCSCDGYENSKGEGDNFPPEDTKKSYEMMQLPEDWEIKIEENLKKILA